MFYQKLAEKLGVARQKEKKIKYLKKNLKAL